MSNVTDFAALIIRIDAATDRLEMDVMELEKLIEDAEGAVSDELAELVRQATASANAAAMSAQTATQAANSASISNNNAAIEANRAAAQVVLAQAEVTKAINQVTAATTQANRAKTEADRAQTIATALLSSAPFQEAPTDGRTYGRNSAQWVVVEGGGSGGTGTVTAVNGTLPDNTGNVTITIPVVPTMVSAFENDADYITLAEIPTVDVPTLTSELTNDSGFITAADVPAVPTKVSQLQNDSNFASVSQLPTLTSQLTNDSAFITAAEVPANPIATDAPSDGKQYARKNAAWSEVVTAGEPVVPFLMTSPSALGLNVNAVKVCFNYALFNAIKTKGTYFWNDAATIDPLNTDANWQTLATYNPLGANTGQGTLDIRFFRVYSLNPTTGAVLGHSGAVWNGTAWLPGNAFLGPVGQITGEYSDGVISQSVIMSLLPAGKWFYPSIVQNYTSGNNQALPTTQIKVNHCLVTKTNIDYGGSSNYPFGHQDTFDLFWIQSSNTASKGQYYWNARTASWINVGTGTA